MADASVKTTPIESPQYRPRMLSFQTATGALTNGKFDGVLTKPGTGTYTITFDRPYLRAPEVGVTCKTADRLARVTASALNSVTIETQDISDGSAADSDFCMIVIGSDAKDAILHP